MVKLDLTDVSFLSPNGEYVSEILFQIEGGREVCFPSSPLRVGAMPRLFTTLLQLGLSVLRHLGFLITISLDYMLLIIQSPSCLIRDWDYIPGFDKHGVPFVRDVVAAFFQNVLCNGHG
jgi:hypothetical protein